MITEKDCRVQPDTKVERMHGESTETSKIDETSIPGPLTPLLVVKATNTITEQTTKRSNLDSLGTS